MSEIGHYDYHPAYRNFVLLVGDDILQGQQERQSNIEAKVGRTIMPWFGATTIATGEDSGINPATVFFDWLSRSPFFLGIPESELDSPSFNAVKLAFADFKISVDTGEQQSTGLDLFAKLSEYGDFWLRRGLDGKIELGYWQQGNINTSGLPIIGTEDLVGEPSGSLNGYDDCYTEVRVRFRDREHFFHDAVAVAFNPGLARVIGRQRSTSLDREWIIDAGVAQQYAQQWLQKYSRPGGSGDSLTVKLSSIEAIEDATDAPIFGQLVKLDIASWTEEIVVRVTRCKYPDDAGGACNLTYDVERSIWPILFIQPPPKKIGNFKVDVPAIVNYKLVELPSGLKTSSATQIFVLAQRPHPNIVGFKLWHSPDDVSYFQDNPPLTFAAYGVLTASYPDTTADVDQTVGMHFELLGVDLIPPSAGHILDYTVLCFVDGERMSVGLVTALGGGIYKSWMWRARYGTTKATHAIGAKAYFILRENIAPIANKSFVAGDTLYFKLQPYNLKQAFDIADFTAFTHLFQTNADVSSPTNLALATSFTITTENKVDSRITATWTFSDDEDITAFNIRIKRSSDTIQWVYSSQGGTATTWRSQLLEPNTSYDVQVQAVGATGSLSDFCPIESIISDAPNPPDAPTGLTITPGIKSVGIEWTVATTLGIAQTQIGLKLVPTFPFGTLEPMEGKPESVVIARDDVDLGYFYSVRHLNSYGVPSAWAAPASTGLQGVPLSAVGKQCATPLIAEGPTGSGTIGTANFRVFIVDRQGSNGPASIFFSFNDSGTWIAYSKTGNYKSTTTGTVLPTTNNGEISCGIGDKVTAYAIQDGFSQSGTDDFFNNAVNAPNRDGGGTGTPVARLP
jgi:hypothetical protein